MDVFIGIDPSLNSTGICFLYYENGIKVKSDYFAITKPNKLSKKEKESQDKYLFFDYHIYEKIDSKDIDDSHIKEINKTLNYINNAITTINIIKDRTSENDRLYIIQEGISYGSLKTKSIYDLAGLNYMLRYLLFKLEKSRYQLSVAFIPPTEIKKFATGSGNCKKEIIVNAFKLIYPNFDLPKIDDICDAYYMALYAKYMKDNNYEIFARY